MIENINISNISQAYSNKPRSSQDNGRITLRDQNIKIDKEKIKSLKSMIESGTYKINIEALAKKIVKELL